MSDMYRDIYDKAMIHIGRMAELLGRIEILAENVRGLDPAERLEQIRALIAEYDAERGVR